MIMTHIKNRIKLIGYVLHHNLKALVTGKMSVRRFTYSLRKQLFLAALFRDSKHVKVGEKVFIDPFAPYYPSSHFSRLLNNNSIDTYPLRPIHGQIAITDNCPCNCTHCHVVNTHSNSLARDKVLETIEDMAKLHFPLVFFVGGEPLTRLDDLCDFITTASRHMDTRIFTSGVGATRRNLKRLQDAGLHGICVSLDHYDENIHNARRRNKNAYMSACNTIRWALELNMYVSVVCCTTRSMLYSGETFAMVDFAESLGAHSIQLNEIRPVGKAQQSNNQDFFLTHQDKNVLIDYYKKENSSRRKIAIVMPWYNEEPDRFGCTATSGQHAYVDAEGNVMPCVLLKASVGNIYSHGFFEIWDKFSKKCQHPVKDCLVYPFNQIMRKGEILPLSPEKTMEVWDEMCRIAPTDIFKKIKVKQRN